MQDLDALIARLDGAISEHRLLDHDFYKAWADGKLTLEDLADYSTQYWRQVEAFPGYLETIATRIESDEAREIVQANLADERDQDHPGLWLDFAEAVGADRERVTRSDRHPETSGCVQEFETAMHKRSPGYALGMLYGYESQTPSVAETKVAGLKRHYEIDGPGTRYFELHGVLDVEHSREMARAISFVADDMDEVVEGARDGAAAIWGLLDGVERVRRAA